MNELQNELLKIITNINTGTESIWKFINEQTPDAIQQLLFWYGIQDFIWFILINLLVIVGLFFSVKYFYKSNAMIEEKYITYDTPPYIMICVYLIIVNLAVFMINIKENLVWLKIWLTPKVWLLEYVSKMVTN